MPTVKAPDQFDTRQGTPFSLDEIRVLLADTVRELRAGTSSPATVNALSNATGKILSSVKLEMDYYKAIGRKPQIEMILGTRALSEPTA
jgi:hypothetical protein